uniref:Uncharacterized protein n=1 Tax=Setaria italica TaxID=4555 RepID=K3YFR3_SETIT
MLDCEALRMPQALSYRWPPVSLPVAWYHA